MPVTVPQTEANLLAYFRTADFPNQDQFEELIRTMFYLYNATLAAAEAAQAASEAVGDRAEGIPKAWGRVRYDTSSNTITVDGEFNGVWSKSGSGNGAKVRFTFDVSNQPPHATNYLLNLSISTFGIDVTQNAAYIEFEYSGSGTFDYNVEFFAFWPDP